MILKILNNITHLSLLVSLHPMLCDGMKDADKNMYFIFFFEIKCHNKQPFLKSVSSLVQSMIWKAGERANADNAFMIELFVY